MGEAIAKACFGVLLLYAGNLLINDSVHGISHELEKRRLDRDIWSDASRRPEIVPDRPRGRRRRHEPEEVKEESNDAD